ncbi:hypothetical protein [Beijerinckia indica]|uniref:Uncharacterized protein n=1 Tax=Beijerinckia indica subsp. indica (strain ATCC 9039 / DSM 1715 / NCIMB 8712) TaxID=395963 RepID=B2IGC8_BEII9|nr:hypothetical protein [Beijerinckia indica]ACB94313.1 hypothetical protein Bind_0663 [Beijerinckia indica subsp. indica ATCC 9039]
MDSPGTSSEPDPSMRRLSGPSPERLPEHRAEHSHSANSNGEQPESFEWTDPSGFAIHDDIRFSLHEGATRPEAAIDATEQAFSEKVLGRLSQAAMLVCLLGLGYMGATHFLTSSPTTTPPAKTPAAASTHAPQQAAAQPAPQAAPQSDTIESLRQEVRSLKQDLDKLHKTVRDDTQEMQGLKAKIAHSAELLKAEEARAEPQRGQEGVTSVAKLDNITKQDKAPVPLPPVKPEKPNTEDRKPTLISSWVVRDVYQGIALVEGKKGALQVARGEMIPGAGRVQSIEKRGQGWVVITNQGLVDSARD